MNVRESIPFVSDLEIKVPPGGQSSPVDSHSRNLTWDSKSNLLLSAILHIDSNQEYGSGAELHINYNGREVGVLHWGAFENGEKQADIDITAYVSEGSNKLDAVYKTAFPAIGGASAFYNANLVMEFDSANSDGSPVQSGGIQDNNFWNNIVTKIKNNAKLIVAGIVLAVIAFGVFKLVTSGSGVGPILNVLRKIARRR